MQTKFYRKCDATGEGMNEGWVVGDGDLYFKYERDAMQWCKDNGYNGIQSAFDEDVMYWTEWEDENDYQYILIDGELHELL